MKNTVLDDMKAALQKAKTYAAKLVSDFSTTTVAALEEMDERIDNIPAGKDGKAATITIGTVTTGGAGTSASVKNVGTDTEAKLDITIPRGATGSQGPRGYYFTPKVDSSGNLSWTNNGSLSNPSTVNIKGQKGDTGSRGSTGPQGPTGPAGPTGSTGAKGERGANATLVVAASNSSAKSKAAADYVCDGTADQEQINAAISALPPCGGKIVLLEGRYNISGPILLNRNNVKLEGMGPHMTELVSQADDINIIEIKASHIGISDLSIAGRPTNRGIRSEWVNSMYDRINICRVTCSDCYNGIQLETVINASVVDCMVTGTDSSLLGIAVQSSNFTIVSRNIIVLHFGQSMQISGSNNIVSDNSMANGDIGIMMYGSSTLIHDNSVVATKDASIQLENGATYNDVSDNFIYGKNYINNGGSTNTFNNNRYQ